MNTQYAICAAWLARAYKQHRNRYSIERSAEHLRYLFYYDGEALPFYTLHTCKARGLLQEFCRIDGEMRHTRSGYPVILDRSGDAAERWDGVQWVAERIDGATLSTFPLYLTRGQVGIFWGEQ